MDERVQFIAECLRGELSMSELCHKYEISRKTGYKWVERFNDGGRPSLRNRRRARQRQERIADAVVVLIVDARKRYPTWGPRKLLFDLRRRYLGWGADSGRQRLLQGHAQVRVFPFLDAPMRQPERRKGADGGLARLRDGAAAWQLARHCLEVLRQSLLGLGLGCSHSHVAPPERR